MKKRITVAVLAIYLCQLNCGFVSSASLQIEKVNFNENQISVLGDYAAGESNRITLITVKKGGDMMIDAVAVAEESCAGDFEFVFDMPEHEDVSGDYEIYLKAANDTETVYEFSYASLKERDELLDELFEAEDIIPILDNEENAVAAECMGINHAAWKGSTDSMKQNVVTLIDGAEDKDTYLKTLNEAINLTLYNEEKDKKSAIELLNELNYKWEDVAYSDMGETRQKLVNEEMMKTIPYEDFDAAGERFNEINALYDLGNAKTGEIEDMLEKYADILGYDSDSSYEKYKKLSKKATANDKIVNGLYSKNDYTVEGLKDILESAVKTTSKPSSGGSGSGSGGGGTSFVGSKDKISSEGGVAAGAVAVVPTENAAETKVAFSDLSEAEWASETIKTLAEKNLVSGYTDGTFKPNGTVKREEFISMIIRAADLNLTGVFCDFKDVDHDAWYYPYVASGYTNGIINGIGNELMGIGNNVTRQDMAVIVDKTMARMRMERNIMDADIKFADDAEISDYAKESVKKLAGMGIIAGKDGKFVPKGYLTRAEAARVIYALFVE